MQRGVTQIRTEDFTVLQAVALDQTQPSRHCYFVGIVGVEPTRVITPTDSSSPRVCQIPPNADGYSPGFVRLPIPGSGAHLPTAVPPVRFGLTLSSF